MVASLHDRAALLSLLVAPLDGSAHRRVIGLKVRPQAAQTTWSASAAGRDGGAPRGRLLNVEEGLISREPSSANNITENIFSLLQ